MLIISAGMQKSGSGYLYNLINDLVVAAGNADARDIKKRYRLEGIMQQHNNNIGPMHPKKLLRLWMVSLKEGAFTVKTHSHPTLGAKILNSAGLLKIIYCYRDPRDVLLSAMDHGKKSLDQEIQDNFIHMIEFDAALRHVKGWVEIWKQYHAIPGILMLKYEELINNPLAAMQAIRLFLGLSLDESAMLSILWKYSKENPDGDRTGLHLNKAVTARHVNEMTDEQKNKAAEAFASDLKEMGYL
jgi:hypothetical protein